MQDRFHTLQHVVKCRLPPVMTCRILGAPPNPLKKRAVPARRDSVQVERKPEVVSALHCRPDQETDRTIILLRWERALSADSTSYCCPKR